MLPDNELRPEVCAPLCKLRPRGNFLLGRNELMNRIGILLLIRHHCVTSLHDNRKLCRQFLCQQEKPCRMRCRGYAKALDGVVRLIDKSD